MDQIKSLAVEFGRDERGATAIEYGLIGVLISITIVASTTQIGEAVKGFFVYVAGKVGAIVI